MERILFSSKGAEIIDYSSPLILYPIRHHSPVCSYHLIKIIEKYRPDIILIEGPENANHLIDVLTDEKTELPAAFYCYYKDTKAFVSEDKKDFKCYYPFQYSSPEYNGAIQAKKLGIPAEFIDLPYSELLINTAENHGMRKNVEKHSYTDDSRFTKGEFYKRLCEKTGMRSFEEFWEKYFEIGGLYMSSDDFVRQMSAYCTLMRVDVANDELEADGTLVREQYMAYNISEAMKKYGKVLAVTGGFHTAGLKNLLNSKKYKPYKLHKFSQKDHGCYPMAYSYRASDALRGYASGMMYPGFYDNIMKKLTECEQPDGVYGEQTMTLLVRTAKEASKRDVQVTMSDITAAYTMMNGLAALRNSKETGISEVFDSVTSCFIKGEKTISSSLPLDILSELATGSGIGHIGDTHHIPPLVADFEKQCGELGLKYQTAVPVKVEVSLFNSKKGQLISRFMHRMNFLGTGFAKFLKGPDIHNNRDRSRVREEWQFRRSPEVDAALIDHTTDGFTIMEACGTYAEKLLNAHRRCETAAGIAVDCFLMGIPLTSAEQEKIDSIITDEGDFFSIGNGLSSFNTLLGLQRLYEFKDGSTLKYVIRCFDKLISALPSMADVPTERSEETVKIIRLMYMIAANTLTDRLGTFESALLTMTSSREKDPLVHGAAMGLLCAVSEKHRSSAERFAKGYLSGSLEIRKKGADYLRGLFTTSKDIVFTNNSFLEMTDKLIISMEFDDFLEILPSLKLAFSVFTPSELQLTAKTAAELHGMKEGEILGRKAVNEKMFRFGESFDVRICETIGKENLLYDK